MGFMAIAAALIGAAPLNPAAPAAVCSMEDLLQMDECTLRELFSSANPGPAPSGYTPGRALVAPGKRGAAFKSNLVKHVWQGKYFLDDSTMINRIFGIKFIKGEVRTEPS